MAGDNDMLLKILSFLRRIRCGERQVTRQAIAKDRPDAEVILSHTWIHISELCGLMIRNIDLENKVINIDHQL